MRIAYGKLGRSIPLTLEDASSVGGDIEVVRLLDALLAAGHEIHLVGRNRGIWRGAQQLHVHVQRNETNGTLIDEWHPTLGTFKDPPPASRHKDDAFDLYNQFIQERAHRLPKFDAWLIWLGQHGSSLHPVPAVQEGKVGTYTNPMVSDLNYGHPLVAMVNRLEVKPIWLCPDPRNMIKFRDLWDPDQREILAQFNTSKDNTFYDERDGKLRRGGTRYRYSGIELLAVPPLEPSDYPPIVPPQMMFGLLVNEGYNNLGTKGRLHQIMRWTLGAGIKDDYEIFGTWSEPSQKMLARTIEPVPLRDVTNTLRRWKATMTFPATGGGWATSKPWEAFKAGTVCFKHPDYDSQHHIYGKHMPDDLRSYLCPATASGLKARLEDLKDDSIWRNTVHAQYEYFKISHERLKGGAAQVFETIDNVTAVTA